MKSTLLIKDLALDKELGSQAMATVRGGYTAQVNGTYQGSSQALNAGVVVGNGSAFLGDGGATFNVVSAPVQDSYSGSYSANEKGWGFPFLPLGVL